MSTTHYMLVDEQTLRPVPLPHYCTTSKGEPVTVVDYSDPAEPHKAGYVYVKFTERANFAQSMRYYPSVCGLKLITEAAYMEAQSNG